MKKLITGLAILALLTLPTFGEKLGSRTKLARDGNYHSERGTANKPGSILRL